MLTRRRASPTGIFLFLGQTLANVVVVSSVAVGAAPWRRLVASTGWRSNNGS